MEKTIDFQGYNRAILIKLNEDGSILCDLEQWDVLEDGSEQFVIRECNISFDEGSYPFEISEEELEELRPKIHEGDL